MDDKVFKELVKRFQAGECTEKEIELLHHWLDILEADSRLTDPSTEELESLREQSLANILPHTKQETPNRKLWPVVGKIAAAFILVSSVALYIFQQYGSAKIVTVSTGNQQIKKIQLPDGSYIWLYAGTTIEYSEPFIQKERVVRLKGQAFFDVKRDTLHPFVVNTFGITTTVLGTSFNITAYPQNTSVQVAVASGKVKVGDTRKAFALLTPSDRITVQKSNHTSEMDHVDPSAIKRWTSGEIFLRNASLKEVLQTLEQYYGVNFKTHFNTNEGNFTLKLNQKLSLDQALDIIQLVSYQPKIRFEIKEKTIHVYRTKIK
ncbi:FecR domain-containing protein [Cytophagaceae bacterium DM2B3-1]|uniref:FecR domain-containing protein n=1 Tax=Xanthocytophaga flava TaxID=3048013 RepID=A0ABT7CGC4_9BACT|nr:FecR domain-containing protein [Xanthocytophaga flavus]MDJ1472009.1 FecR domain-containing protein [Xanthocytophaga flavus]MDJ1492793.1 FecR domain-containing protein [Xanthocytophaga flavus]